MIISNRTRQFLQPELIEEVEDSLLLIDCFLKNNNQKQPNDFAFAVFPLAKAYEGFLKKFFKELGVLSAKHYESRHFRIGRSFNPDLPHKLRDEVWLYDDVAAHCGSDLARQMWQLWIDGRNHLFHFFPGARYELTLAEAQKMSEHFLQLMDQALECLN